jgi:hypothetical protein
MRLRVATSMRNGGNELQNLILSRFSRFSEMRLPQ